MSNQFPSKLAHDEELERAVWDTLFEAWIAVEEGECDVAAGHIKETLALLHLPWVSRASVEARG